jgi:hypothetical protein
MTYCREEQKEEEKRVVMKKHMKTNPLKILRGVCTWICPDFLQKKNLSL